MKFVTPEQFGIDTLADIYRKSTFKNSDYSLGIKLMWKNLRSTFAVANGCLVALCRDRGVLAFDYPLPFLDGADEEKTLSEMAEYCAYECIPFRIHGVPKDRIDKILSLFSTVEISTRRDDADYIYDISEMMAFSGKKFSGQRNHVKKFLSLYPTAKFEVFSACDKPRIKEFFRAFGGGRTTKGAKTEQKFAVAMTKFVGSKYFLSGGYVLDGKILSFSLLEVCGETLIDHIEKALPGYEGIYPATVQALTNAFGVGVKYFNREDDAGSKGLRISKLQYHPSEILYKYDVFIKTPLNALKKCPVLEGEVLLDAITEADKSDYFRLCTDEKRNEFWGYEVPEKSPTPDYFYLDQKTDFKRRTALNLAIRKGGKFVGEVILYGFDFSLSAEIGVRILPEYDGQKLGRTALNMLADYALYSLGFSFVRAKCYKENLPSKACLSSFMQSYGEDGKFYYFRKFV